jgi:signal transduction histidine kinase
MPPTADEMSPPSDGSGGDRAAPPERLAELAPARTPIRGVLFAGLVVLFALWLVTGYELIRNLSEAERRVNDVHAAFVRGETTLTTIRTSVLLGSIYLRDALIDTTGTRQYYRDELREIRANIEQRLPTLAVDAELPVEQAEWQQLKDSLDAYWATLDLFLGPEAPTNYVQGTGVLRRQVVPARTNVLGIVDRLADLQRLAQQQREAEASALYTDVRLRFIAIGVATLLIGAGVSWFVLYRVGGLERELYRRRLAEGLNRRDLQRLSARLVDAQEQERRVLARELHDEVGQALTALKIDVGVALRAAESDARIRVPLEEARAIAEGTLQSIRDLSQLLHPSILDDFGLPEAVASYVRSFSKRTGIRTDVTVAGFEDRLPAGVEVAVYRIIQEALTNVGRHSHATTCSVSVTHVADALQVIVEDDGCGLSDGGAIPMSRGLGVIGMRERAQSLSGTFAIERRISRGTRVGVMIPLALEPRAVPEPVAR